MILTVLALFLPPPALLKGLRHRLYALHLAIMLALSWLRFPSFDYPLWHEYYPYFLTFAHLVSINLVTAFAYCWDKRQARRSLWRVPERTLHALAFIGGTPAAFLASKIFRHKTISGPFRRTFRAVVVLQAILLGAVIWLG